MTSPYSWLSVTIAVILGITVSCSPPKERPIDGGRLRLGYSYKPSEINPITTDSGISATLLDLIFNTLVHVGRSKETEPELASSWDISADGLVWIFHLRRDVRFHDGTPLTAHDVQATYEMIQKTARSGYSYAFKTVEAIEAVDDATLKIQFKEPDSLLMDSLGVIGIAPKHLLKNDPDYERMNRQPIGSGPYRFVHQDAETILLEANASYFAGRPHLDQIIVRILPNQAAILSHLILGEIDMAFLLHPEDYGALAQIPSIRVYRNWYPLSYLIALNQKNSLFHSTKVRQALNLVTNRERIFQKAFKGDGVLAAGTVHPSHYSYDPKTKLYDYRPTEALVLLKEEGWEDRNGDYILDRGGKPFQFQLVIAEGDESSVQIAQMVEQQLRDVGIVMKIIRLPLNDYVDRVYRQRSFDAMLGTHVFRSAYDSNYTFWHSSHIQDGLNFASYSNIDVDHRLDEARLSQDSTRRQEAFWEFQKILHQDPPGIFLFWRDMPIAIHQKFKGVPEERMESLRDLVKFWIAKEKS